MEFALFSARRYNNLIRYKLVDLTTFVKRNKTHKNHPQVLMKKLLLLFLLFSTIAGKVFSQAVGDYRSVASGVWTTTATWQTWNGTAWVAPPPTSYPSVTSNVNIRNGHTIVFSTSTVPCNDLVVDAGGKLYSNSNSSNFYLNVFGDTLLCNGTIGNPPNFDGISFNIEGASCRILGSGVFDASRIRKSAATNPLTNLSIERDVKLRFGGGRQTQIYNNGPSACRFNITVAAGATLMLDSVVSANCPTATGNSLSTIVSGLNVNANNSVIAISNTSALSVGQLVTGPGIILGSTITSIIANTSITLSQNPFLAGVGVSLTFGGNIVTTTSNITVYSALFALPGSLIGCRVSGAGIAPNATITSVTGAAPNFVFNLSLPNTGNVTGPLSFISDGNAAMDGNNGLNGSALSGNYTINGTMIITGLAYFNTNNTVAADSVCWTVNNGGLLKVGNIQLAASGTSKNILRIMPGGKFEVFGLPGFASNIVTTVAGNGVNNIFDIQTGSFTEFSGLGSQNIPVIPTAPSSGGYGNLKISGFGIKTSLFTPFRIYNNLDILNTSGAPVFNATASTNFFVGGNWTNYHDSAYVEASNTVYFNGSTGIQSITCSSGEVFSTLRYLKTDGLALQMNSDVKVKTQLYFTSNGFLNLNGNTLSVYSSSPSAISGGNTLRYIYGETGNFNSKVRWNIGTTTANTRYTIPFAKGSGSANYTPFAFTVGPNVQVDTMTVSTYGTPATNLPWPTAAPYGVSNLNSSTNLSPDNRDATADRFWYVGFSSPSVINDTIALSYASNEIPLSPYNDPTLLKAQYWNSNAGPTGSWTLPSLGYYGTLFGVSGVVVPSPVLNNVWALASNSSPLPIELVDFRGKYINNQSVLSWVTASEKDNDYFILERSEDAREFTQIGKIDGAGNSNSFLNYQFIDIKPINKVAYYRLKQVDFDGQFSNSNVIALRDVKSLGNQFLNLYPQPASTDVFVEQGLFINGETFSVEIFNNLGALVQKDLHTSDESGKLVVQLKNLKQGMYMLRISDGIHQLTKPLIIQ
jgi:hypothetical protein